MRLYDKDGNEKIATTYADSIQLRKQGYTTKKPRAKDNVVDKVVDKVKEVVKPKTKDKDK